MYRMPLISVAVLAFTALVFAQDIRVIRWQDSGPASKRLLREGIVAKQLVVAQVSVSAAITDRSDSFCVQLEIDNAGQSTVDVRPGSIRLQKSQPSSQNLFLITAQTLAERVRRSANSRAAGIEGQASIATTTVHEQVPVLVTSFNPASILDPTQPTTITTPSTETIVKLAPDETARLRAQAEAQTIRGQAETESRRIVALALTDARLSHGSHIAGTLYFEHDDKLEEAIVLIPIGAVTVEIPFRTLKRWAWLGGRTMIFQ
jgi:hypothetical protein